jgi:hypothetical protein
MELGMLAARPVCFDANVALRQGAAMPTIARARSFIRQLPAL